MPGFKPIDPFFGQSDLSQFVIYSNEPNRKVNPKTDYKKQTLKQVCDDIKANQAQADEKLCRNLEAYQARSCGTGQFNGVNRTCNGVVGGGLFQSANKMQLAAVSLDFSGQATIKDKNVTFLDIDGALTAFNYATRVRVDSVAMSSLTGTKTDAKNFELKAVGKATVAGKTGVGISISMKLTDGKASVTIVNTDTKDVLVDGTTPLQAQFTFNQS